MQLISLSEAARSFPKRNGRYPHVVSIRRRILHGAHGVKLRAVRDGRDWFTCLEWIQEFMEACTRQALPAAKADPRMTAWANEQAKRDLKERFGINVDPNAAAYLAELEAEIAAEGQVSDVCENGAASGPLSFLLPSRVSAGRGGKSDVGRAGSRRPGQAVKAKRQTVPLVESGREPPEETRD